MEPSARQGLRRNVCPCQRFQSIRMALAIAADMDWDVVQLSLRGYREHVFVEMAPGYETTHKENIQLVVKLGKSLHGLAQGPQN